MKRKTRYWGLFLKQHGRFQPMLDEITGRLHIYHKHFLALRACFKMEDKNKDLKHKIYTRDIPCGVPSK